MDSERPIQPVKGRRDVLRNAAFAAGIALAGSATPGTARGGQTTQDKHEREEAEVTPGEDLMQEHGVLERILLIYDEAAHRIEHDEQLDLAVVTSAASIVRHFVELPREAGGTVRVPAAPDGSTGGRPGGGSPAPAPAWPASDGRHRPATRRGGDPELARVLRSFARMYRPHAAREDTVLFPAFRDTVGRSGYRELGEQFEERSTSSSASTGSRTPAEVARLEARLGIADLARFTAP